MEGYQPYSTFVEEGIRSQHSFMFSNESSVTLWHSSKAADSIRNHKVFPYEPRHEISNNVVCATSKGSDQPAYTRSLIRAFARRLNIL